MVRIKEVEKSAVIMILEKMVKKNLAVDCKFTLKRKEGVNTHLIMSLTNQLFY